MLAFNLADNSAYLLLWSNRIKNLKLAAVSFFSYLTLFFKFFNVCSIYTFDLVVLDSLKLLIHLNTEILKASLSFLASGPHRTSVNVEAFLAFRNPWSKNALRHFFIF
jgi:hypothetical protein